MGRVRQAVVRLKCGECGADGHLPCVNKRTRREIKGFHSSRRFAGRNDALNREVAKIERDEEADGMLRFFWEGIGLPANKYPPPGKPYWHFMPELDPDDQYNGNF